MQKTGDILDGLRAMVRTRLLVRRHFWELRLAGSFLSLLFAYLLFIFFLDNLVYLSVPLRLASFFLFLGLFAVSIRGLLRRRRRIRFGEDEIALALERHSGQPLENRLINSLQIAREEGDDGAGFRAALLRENTDRLARLGLRDRENIRRLLVPCFLALALVAVTLAFWSFSPRRFTAAAGRLFLPLAPIEPVYRTRLSVEPGDVRLEPGDDLTIRVSVEGRQPRRLVVLSREEDRSGRREVVSFAGGEAVHTFPRVQRSFRYAVRAAGFTSAYYRVEVPVAAYRSALDITYTYPPHTGLSERRLENASHELETIAGARGELRFTLDQPAAAARLLFEDGDGSALDPVDLEPLADDVFRGEVLFRGQAAYRLEVHGREGRRYPGPRYAVRVTPDRSPTLFLSGLERNAQVTPDAVLSLGVAAADDFGLAEVGLFVREAAAGGGRAPAAGGAGEWSALQRWELEEEPTAFETQLHLPAAALGAAEGDALELALRARDNDPGKAGLWTSGEAYRLLVAGEGAELQLLYERILAAGEGIGRLIEAQADVAAAATPWLRRLEPESGLRWDESENLEALAAGLAEIADRQEALRREAGRLAEVVPEEAGTVRVSLGMFADTEMARALVILESVARQDTPRGMRLALAEASLVKERTAAGLENVRAEFTRFRRHWELAHMMPFTEMLARRQETMKRDSAGYTDLPADFPFDPLRRSTRRRQLKVKELAGLAGTAFAGLVDWLDGAQPLLEDAFREAAQSLREGELAPLMSRAAAALGAGRWGEAVPPQEEAAGILAATHLRLREMVARASEDALAQLQQLAEGDAELQAELEKLQAGSESGHVGEADMAMVRELVRQREMAGGDEFGDLAGERGIAEPPYFEEWMRDQLSSRFGSRPDTDMHFLRDSAPGLTSEPSGHPGFAPSDVPVNPMAGDHYEDLVGDLLAQADDLQEVYETLGLIAALGAADEGAASSESGAKMSSAGAVAQTGNVAPPSVNVGGASRAGRLGARAFGRLVGDEFFNRRGRDQAQEGQERVADQAGAPLQEIETDDMQEEASTGVGGRRIDTDESSFSVADAGEWTDDMVERLGEAQERHQVVERHGEPLDHRVAERLRAAAGAQEQIVERIKTIRKELRNIYLPTDHLDDLIARLEEGLDQLRREPGPEFFRTQLQALDDLRANVIVFRDAQGGIFPSVPRPAYLRGRILDEAALQAAPGYEEALEYYYRRLAEI